MSESDYCGSGNERSSPASHEARIERGQRLIIADTQHELFYVSDCEEGVYFNHEDFEGDDGRTTLYLSHKGIGRIAEWLGYEKGSGLSCVECGAELTDPKNRGDPDVNGEWVCSEFSCREVHGEEMALSTTGDGRDV